MIYLKVSGTTVITVELKLSFLCAVPLQGQAFLS